MGGMNDQVEQYVQSVPSVARPVFDELRSIVKAELSAAREVASYGVIGYKVDEGRARVFIGGWKDHVALYPVPHDESLLRECAPYQKGKGTLWFSLQKPLPKQLIKRVIAALA